MTGSWLTVDMIELSRKTRNDARVRAASMNVNLAALNGIFVWVSGFFSGNLVGANSLSVEGACEAPMACSLWASAAVMLNGLPRILLARNQVSWKVSDGNAIAHCLGK